MTVTVETFLDYVWRPDDPISQNYYGCITPQDVYRNVFCPLGTTDTDSSAFEQVAEWDVWFCPALFWNNQDRTRANIAGTWVLWVDVDNPYEDKPETLDSLLKRLPLPPTFVVESSKGRFHVYWCLSEFLREKEQIQKLNTALSEAIKNADGSGWDAGQLLRLPLGTNTKETANGHKPVVVYMDTDAYLPSN